MGRLDQIRGQVGGEIIALAAMEYSLFAIDTFVELCGQRVLRKHLRSRGVEGDPLGAARVNLESLKVQLLAQRDPSSPETRRVHRAVCEVLNALHRATQDHDLLALAVKLPIRWPSEGRPGGALKKVKAALKDLDGFGWFPIEEYISVDAHQAEGISFCSDVATQVITSCETPSAASSIDIRRNER